MSAAVKITAYPTRRAVLAMALGLPVSLLIALIFPALWVVGAAWLAGVLGLIAVDWLAAAKAGAFRPQLDIPSVFEIGETTPIQLRLDATPGRSHEARLATSFQLIPRPVSCAVNERETALPLYSARRGDAEIEALFQRWTGPFGLIWSQREDRLKVTRPVINDRTALAEQALNLFTRHAPAGLKLIRQRGQGTEFDALTEFTRGMDPRNIDWKHSARHNELLVREFETEKNHHIHFVFDSGYLMSEETEDEGGRVLTKLDRALSAALLMGFLSLKVGDRVSLFAFDEKPYLYVPPLSGPRSFARLLAESAAVDYSASEPNFTLGLTTLSQKLGRRSLIVIFSDFNDTIQAELMLENVARLMRRHRVIFVTFRSQSLTAISDAEPNDAKAVASAIVAATLQRERELVLSRLKRMGVDVIDTDPDAVNAELINTYMDLKARNAL